MLKFLARRLFWLFPVLLVILAVIFLLMHAIPGSPWDFDILGAEDMDEISKQTLIRSYGLDKPLWVQFTTYLVGHPGKDGAFVCGLICGNMGPSFRLRGNTVQNVLFGFPKGKTFFQSAFIYTLRLSLYAFVLALLIGVPLGIAAATRQGTWVDLAVKTFSTLLMSIPNFVLGLLIIIILGGDLHLIVIAPASWENIDPRVWLTPIVILGTGTLAALIRITRTSVLETLGRDYVRTARAKGASNRRVVYRHIFKNALIPILTFTGPALLELFAGSFVIEMMFGYPGMGKEFVLAAQRLDYPMVMGISLVYALLISVVNLTVDLLYGVIDPRIRVV